MAGHAPPHKGSLPGSLSLGKCYPFAIRRMPVPAKGHHVDAALSRNDNTTLPSRTFDDDPLRTDAIRVERDIGGKEPSRVRHAGKPVAEEG